MVNVSIRRWIVNDMYISYSGFEINFFYFLVFEGRGNVLMFILDRNMKGLF